VSLNIWLPISIVILIFIIGFVKTVLACRATIINHDFAIEYMNKYREFCSPLYQNTFNGDKYQWLKMNSSKMQRLMGSFGIAAVYKPPGANHIFRNYEMLVNGISGIRESYTQMASGYGLDLDRRILHETISMIDDMLLTFIGAADNLVDEAQKELKNPLIWLREGVRFIVTSPISLMYWSGLIRYRTYNTLSNNFLVKLLSFLIGVIGIVSSIVTIVTGYTPFRSLIGF
jgi:hypothetical protein